MNFFRYLYTIYASDFIQNTVHENILDNKIPLFFWSNYSNDTKSLSLTHVDNVLQIRRLYLYFLNIENNFIGHKLNRSDNVYCFIKNLVLILAEQTKILNIFDKNFYDLLKNKCKIIVKSSYIISIHNKCKNDALSEKKNLKIILMISVNIIYITLIEVWNHNLFNFFGLVDLNVLFQNEKPNAIFVFNIKKYTVDIDAIVKSIYNASKIFSYAGYTDYMFFIDLTEYLLTQIYFYGPNFSVIKYNIAKFFFCDIIKYKQDDYISFFRTKNIQIVSKFNVCDFAGIITSIYHKDNAFMSDINLFLADIMHLVKMFEAFLKKFHKFLKREYTIDFYMEVHQPILDLFLKEQEFEISPEIILLKSTINGIYMVDYQYKDLEFFGKIPEKIHIYQL